MCHTPQTIDPDTGNTVDMKVFVHKIHMGKQLPSVQAGKPYQIIGFNQARLRLVDGGSAVRSAALRVLPRARRPGAAQADAWLKNPSRAACGSCHDNVNFATGENHVNLPQVDDNQCTPVPHSAGRAGIRRLDQGRAHRRHRVDHPPRRRSSTS